MKILGRMNRSYLYGRLFAILEKKERITYYYNHREEEKFLTSVQKLRVHYRNSPASAMQTIMDTIQPYIDMFIQENLELYLKIEIEIQQIITLLNKYYLNSDNLNKPLDYRFMFGYYSESDFNIQSVINIK